MPLRSGAYTVEHWLDGKKIATFPTGRWSDPVLGDLQQLAQTSLRDYWVPLNGTLVRRSKLGRAPPDLIVVTNDAGEEIFRWSLDDERALTLR